MKSACHKIGHKKKITFFPLFGRHFDVDYVIKKLTCSWLQIWTGSMLYKFQVDSANTLQVRHNKLLCKRKKRTNKHGRHDQADYVIKPKRGRSLWDLDSTIVLKFGEDAFDRFCCIEARKLVVEKIKTATRGRWVTFASRKEDVRWRRMRVTLCENFILIGPIVFAQSLRQKSR